MKQRDLFLDGEFNTPNASFSQSNIHENRKNVSQKAFDALSWVWHLIFKQWPYQSYKIEWESNKISKIYFIIGKEKFLVYIDYNFSKNRTSYTDYTETDQNERERIIEKTYISNFKILWIQKKVKVWYGEIKNNPNYFKYDGIDYFTLKSFLEEWIKKYHQ